MAFLKFTLNEIALLTHVNRLQGDMPFVRQDLLLQRHSDGAPGSGGGHERPACDELVQRAMNLSSRWVVAVPVAVKILLGRQTKPKPAETPTQKKPPLP